ncbi:MAG: hypothetical protein AAGB10_22160, partial [Pseudomonadota bacterium]
MPEVLKTAGQIVRAKPGEDRTVRIFKGLQPGRIEAPADRMLGTEGDDILIGQRLRLADLAAFGFKTRQGLLASRKHLQPRFGQTDRLA